MRVKLTDICRPKQWKTISMKQLSNEGYPVYGANGKIGFYSEYTHEKPVLLIGCRGSCGSLHITEPFSYANGNAMALDDLDESNYLLKYLYYFLLGRGFADVVSGTSQPQITRTGLERVILPTSTLKEQQQIVQILDTADTIRQKRKEQLNLLDDYLKSVFFEMFGDPVTNEKGWKQMSLGEVSSDIKYGTNVKCFDRSQYNTVPVLRIPNIFKGEIDLSDLKYGKVEGKEFKKLLLKKGDLLFVRTNGNPDYIGRCAVFTLDGEYINASYLIRVRLKAQSMLTSFFIYYVVSLPSYRSKIARESRTTAGNYNINTQGLKSLKIIQPPVNLQNKFASIVEQVEQTKQKMHASLDEMDNHFHALMQRYFG